MNENLEKKSTMEDKKYSQLTRESINLFAECGGHSEIPDNIISLLAEDSNYRLREALQNAGHFMRHAKRRKLNSEDFNKALLWSNVEPIYGYSSPEPLPSVFVKEAEVFCPEDKEVNLCNLATSLGVFEQPKQPEVQAQWIAVEGVIKTGPTNGPSTSKKNGGNTSSFNDLMGYYDQVTKAILGSDEDLLKLAIDDIRRNARIAPLLPYLVNFVCIGVKKLSHDLIQLSKLLHTVRALVSNHSLYLGPKPYLHLLVEAVLYCILEPLAASINPINDHWTLRDTAAQLLARIIREWSTPVNNLKDEVLSTLEDSFKDLTKPFCSHYGAAVAVTALGIKSIRERIYPHLAYYWPHLTTALEDCTYISAQVKADAQKVHGTLLGISELILLDQRRKFLDESNRNPSLPDINEESSFEFRQDNVLRDIYSSEVPQMSTKSKHSIDIKQEPEDVKISEYKKCTANPLSAMYSELYEYFGDSLAIRLPIVAMDGIYQEKRVPEVSVFSTSELLQSGEEMLETFYEKDEEMRSNNSIEDDNSYDDRDYNSAMSDDHEADPVDLQIKSTISDPTLGIKLTIAKLRRNKPVKEEPKTKLKKITIRTSKEPPQQEPVFDYTPLTISDPFIEFCFEGSSPVPKNQLKRKRLQNPDNTGFTPSPNVVKMKLKGKVKKPSMKNTKRRIYSTGNLEISL